MYFQLKVITGTNPGTLFTLKEGKTYIGRETTNTIVLTFPEVSRTHCKIIVKSDKIAIKDKGSRTGVWVNGARVSTSYLKAGDRVKIGEVVFEVLAIQEAPPAAACGA